MKTVKFYFGPGSRYSYLAATQVDRISNETGAEFDWLPVFSGNLMARIGNTYLSSTSRIGQYTDEYRSKDVIRWADYYGVPYNEPEASDVDWSLIVRACLAAKDVGYAEQFAKAAYRTSFQFGNVPDDIEQLANIAKDIGIDPDVFRQFVQSEFCEREEDRVLEAAVSEGVFGVPTFAVDNELFWGQDRIPLLIEHLNAR